MKNIIMCSIIALLLTASSSVDAGNNESKAVKGKYGFYYSFTEYGRYVVDTIAQLCYLQHVTLVPCSKLKRRPEWKNIIKWK